MSYPANLYFIIPLYHCMHWFMYTQGGLGNDQYPHTKGSQNQVLGYGRL